MPEEMSATDLVTGWVERFNHERGFGFVSPRLTGRHPIISDSSQVFIHADKCRVFAGTPEQPNITGNKAPADWVRQNIVPGRDHGLNRHDYSYVIMRVTRGDKGPRATAWAIIPRRRSLEDVLQYGGLDAYVGMEVAILPLTKTPGSGLWGVLKRYTLASGRIELALSAAHGPDVHPTQYGDRTEVIEFEDLRIADDSPGSQLTLRLLRGTEQPIIEVVCWLRPPLR